MPLTVVIVGAGLAGLAAAVAATAAGAPTTVLEAGSSLAPPPVHLDVVPGMLRDLVALGVGERCVRAGFPWAGMAAVDLAGRPVFEIPTPRLAGARWPAAMGIGLAALMQVLHDTAVAQGARLHWGVQVSQVQTVPEGCRVVTAGGEAWQGDLALLAGAHGIADGNAGLPAQGERLPQRWDHVLLPRPRWLDRSTWVVGPRHSKAFLVPVGAAQAGLAVLRDPHAEATLPALRAHVAALGPLLARLGTHLAPDAVVVPRPVHSGLLAGPWHAGAVLRIGSSAHLLPPHFGQAAAQSVEDATVLRDLLQAGLPRDALLQQFMQRRAARAAQVHALATQAARWDVNPEPSTDLPALARQLAAVVAQPA